MDSCWGTKRDGEPCSYRGRSSYSGLCGVHWRMLQERLASKEQGNASSGKVSKVSDQAAKWLGIASSIIAIAEAIYIAFSELPWGDEPETSTQDELAEAELRSATARDLPPPNLILSGMSRPMYESDTMTGPPSWRAVNALRKEAATLQPKETRFLTGLRVRVLSRRTTKFLRSLDKKLLHDAYWILVFRPTLREIGIDLPRDET